MTGRPTQTTATSGADHLQESGARLRKSTRRYHITYGFFKTMRPISALVIQLTLAMSDQRGTRTAPQGRGAQLHWMTLPSPGRTAELPSLKRGGDKPLEHPSKASAHFLLPIRWLMCRCQAVERLLFPVSLRPPDVILPGGRGEEKIKRMNSGNLCSPNAGCHGGTKDRQFNWSADLISTRILYRIKGHVDGPTKDPSRHLASSHTEFGTHGPIISWMVLEFHPSRFIPGSRIDLTMLMDPLPSVFLSGRAPQDEYQLYEFDIDWRLEQDMISSGETRSCACGYSSMTKSCFPHRCYNHSHLTAVIRFPELRAKRRIVSGRTSAPVKPKLPESPDCDHGSPFKPSSSV
ncbi:hypothetical protein V8E55_007255 [Tylopilus felleus]